MTSLIRRRHLVQVSLWLLLGAMVAWGGMTLRAITAADEQKAPAGEKNGQLGPTYDPTPTWLPKPVPVENADAASEKEMKAYRELLHNTLGSHNKEVGFDMLPIPGGKYLMGASQAEFRNANKDDKDAKYDEGPQHEVAIESFWMGKYEVTWEEYEQWGVGLDKKRRTLAKIKNTPWDKPWDELADHITQPTMPYTDMSFNMGKQGCPATCMTQLAAQCYCKWLSAKTGRYYRLPTEAEWEYACRAGTKTAYSFGDDPAKLGDYAWYSDNSDDKYHKVGQKKPNPWGLYDMHGNVAEWVLDQYIPDYYKQFEGKVTTNPWAKPTREYPRVVRGGSWDNPAEKLRSAARMASNKDWKKQDPQIPQSFWYLTDASFVGFRVIRPLRVPTAEEAKQFEPTAEVLKDAEQARSGKE